MRNGPREISTATRLTGIFGDPVAHSLSPGMHNAAYEALGLDRKYVAFRVAAQDLRAALRSIPALGLLGVNLTVPHKEPAARMIDQLSPEARTLAAVNCVINRQGSLIGDNTDARGLERDLRELKVSLAGLTSVVIGAGGAASAAILALIRLRASRIVIANRTLRRARQLTRRFAETAGKRTRLEARGLEVLMDQRLLADTACVINATPMGLTTRTFTPIDYASTPSWCFFYDMVYARKTTPFLSGARKAHRTSADGAGMLIAQGELAFRLFNGVDSPKDCMRNALTSALGR